MSLYLNRDAAFEARHCTPELFQALDALAAAEHQRRWAEHQAFAVQFPEELAETEQLDDLFSQGDANEKLSFSIPDTDIHIKESVSYRGLAQRLHHVTEVEEQGRLGGGFQAGRHIVENELIVRLRPLQLGALFYRRVAGQLVGRVIDLATDLT